MSSETITGWQKLRQGQRDLAAHAKDCYGAAVTLSAAFYAMSIPVRYAKSGVG